MSEARILIMAGGTGGHVFPALAVAEYLRDSGVQVTWLGTRRGIESRVVPRAAFPIRYLSIGGLRGKGLLGWLSAPLRLAWALAQALRIVLRDKPEAVLGLGGFVTGPGGVAAWLLRRPLLIHEQNAVPGMTNRWLARIAVKVMEAFPGSFPAARGAVCTGNPIRREIATLDNPAARGIGSRRPLRLLVFGGSLGAAALNETVPLALAGMQAADSPQVWHQSGVRNIEQAREAYSRAGVAARLDTFIEDMAQAYAWADLVICRAGALSVSELAASGVASILVPYPYAVDDHQTRNAAYLQSVGAAIVVRQSELSADCLRALLMDLNADRARLLSMAESARARAMPDATERVARMCMEALRA